MRTCDDVAMSNLSRRGKESRAYSLVVVGGGASVVAVVGVVLWVIGVLSFGVPFLAAIVAAICFFMFRGTTR